MASNTDRNRLDTGEESKQAQEWQTFLAACGKKVCKDHDAQAFLAWAQENGPVLLPSLTAQAADQSDVPKLFRAMAVSILSQLPIPANGWQPQPVTRPGRNEPCWCGSGKKFKHCCDSLRSFPFPSVNLLRFVLDACPVSQFAELASTGHPSLEAVADTARQWIAEGDSKRAVALLEPFLAAPKVLTVKLDGLFDELMSALLAEDQPKRRLYWIEQVLARGDNAFKAVALQQRAVMHSDLGEFDACWADFAQARHLNPNDPSLSMLEVSLLMGQNRSQEAAQRAAWWAQHLARVGDPAYADLIGHLQSFAREPAQAMINMAGAQAPGFGELVKLLQSAPAPAPMHSLFVNPASPGATQPPAAIVEPTAQLRTLEAQWRDCFAQAKPMLVSVQNNAPEVWDNFPQWQSLLQRNPALFNSFDVLDDLVMATDALNLPFASQGLLVQLAERAAELLRLLLERHPAPVQVPWIVHDNRVVLRPIAHLAFVCRDSKKWDRFMELAHWLVLELNPNDNHGLRWELSQAYLMHGRDQDALNLDQRYPDEASPVLNLNRVLALFRLGQLAQARAALETARLEHPKVIAMLLKANPKPVKPDGLGIIMGGAYEAWLYVQSHRSLWQASGALVWAQQVLKK